MPAGGTVAKVSIAGLSPRSGASSSAAASSSPRTTASRTTKELPRSGSGISGKGGKARTRPTELTSSGMEPVHSSQAPSTSGARSSGKNSAPA